MAECTIEMAGREYVYPSKKEMLKDVGRSILEASDEPMTLRQLYYRFVALDLIPNKESQYSYLGEAVRDARLEGTIPWEWIEDRTRSSAAGDHRERGARAHFNAYRSSLESCHEKYHRPRWEGQDDYIEVWVEKEALAGVFERVCEDLGVVSFPCRGYSSITMLKDAADRMSAAADDDLDPTILYFGDFDPSGQDIERNIRDSLRDTFGVDVDVDRRALTRPQIDERELPPQPAKRTDSRYDDFVEEHGDLAVELDALDPQELRGMVREAVSDHFDEQHYRDVVLKRQADDRESIKGWVEEALDD